MRVATNPEKSPNRFQIVKTPPARDEIRPNDRRHPSQRHVSSYTRLSTTFSINPNPYTLCLSLSLTHTLSLPLSISLQPQPTLVRPPADESSRRASIARSAAFSLSTLSGASRQQYQRRSDASSRSPPPLACGVLLVGSLSLLPPSSSSSPSASATQQAHTVANATFLAGDDRRCVPSLCSRLLRHRR